VNKNALTFSLDQVKSIKREQDRILETLSQIERSVQEREKASKELKQEYEAFEKQ
jgi:hypothetical protein